MCPDVREHGLSVEGLRSAQAAAFARGTRMPWVLWGYVTAGSFRHHRELSRLDEAPAGVRQHSGWGRFCDRSHSLARTFESHVGTQP